MLLKKLQEQHIKNSNNCELNSNSNSRKVSSQLNTINTNNLMNKINNNNFKNNDNENFENQKKINEEDKCKKYNLQTDNQKLNFVKILNETSLNTNLITDNGNTINNTNNINNNSFNDMNIDKNGYLAFYSSSRLWKIIKIFFLYIVQFLRKHKAALSLTMLILMFLKRKSIIDFMRKMIGS